MKKNVQKPFSDARWWDNPQPRFSPCGTCAHYHGFGKCDAFEKIPLDILSGRVLHDKPYTGDNGIMYEQSQKPD